VSVAELETYLETFRKLPLGGVDRRALVGLLAERGPSVARELLARQRAALRPAGTRLASDSAVLILGGSNGITRALAVQLLFAEHASVYCVHYDSEKMQIGVHHADAIAEAAEREGLTARFFNRDATRDETIAELCGELSGRFRAVHFVNGIAAGATKRYACYGPTKVRDLDVAFDPVLQVPDFGRADHIRKFGLVEVEVANEVEIERTNKFMGSSTLQWVAPLADAGLIARGESVVAFCDYDFEPDDPVYAMGPLAGAKVLQRNAMATVRERWGARTVRLCYPAMCTTALGAIPGGVIMYALTAQILLERGAYQSIEALAEASMAIWREPSGAPATELRLDSAYQRALPEFHRRKLALRPNDVPAAFAKLVAMSAH
jgi:enoyl-[acyl-carrier protein] reductase/trans-2-enoyl-CoA reductase (NAD+)